MSSYSLEFLAEALAEMECATGDYHAIDPGLGVKFRELVESTAAAIVQHPLLWREREGAFRRVNLPGFPFHLIFVIRESRIVVCAVAHGSRHPDYWKNRMP